MDPRSGLGFSVMSSRLWEFLEYFKVSIECRRQEQFDGWERVSPLLSGVVVHACDPHGGGAEQPSSVCVCVCQRALHALLRCTAVFMCNSVSRG